MFGQWGVRSWWHYSINNSPSERSDARNWQSDVSAELAIQPNRRGSGGLGYWNGQCHEDTDRVPDDIQAALVPHGGSRENGTRAAPEKPNAVRKTPTAQPTITNSVTAVTDKAAPSSVGFLE